MLDSRTIELMTTEVCAGVQEKDSMFITDDESRKVWQNLETFYNSLKSSGIAMAIAPEWDNSNYVAGSMYDDDFDEKLAEMLGETTPVGKMSLVTKAVNENRYTLGPMYVPDRLDAHGEWTDSAELQKSVWDYVRKGDRRIRLQHNRDVVAGEFVEVMAWPHEIAVPMQKADGTQEDVTFPANTVFLGVVWEPWAWEMVKAGDLRGYSIGGRAQRLEVDLPMAKDVAGDTTSGSAPDMNVNTVHEDTIMGTPPKKKKKAEQDVSGEEQS